MAKSIIALVVDDNEVNRMVCEELLGDYGVEVHLAEGGAKALRLAERIQFDIVFLDHIMPGMDGPSVCRKLRAKGGRYAKIPVIAMTGNDAESYEREYKDAGIDGWMSKPFEPEALEKILDVWLGGFTRKSGKTDCEDNMPRWFSVLNSQSRLDATRGLSLMRGSCEAYRKLLTAFCFQVKDRTQLMTDLLQTRHLEAYAVEVHSFKGSLYNIGAAWLAEMAKELEMYADRNQMASIIGVHTEFIEELSELSSEIERALSTTEAQGGEMPHGDIQALEKGIEQALEAMKDFETNTAADIIRALRGLRFTPELDMRVAEIETLLDSYQFERTVSELASMHNQLKGVK